MRRPIRRRGHRRIQEELAPRVVFQRVEIEVGPGHGADRIVAQFLSLLADEHLHVLQRLRLVVGITDQRNGVLEVRCVVGGRLILRLRREQERHVVGINVAVEAIYVPVPEPSDADPAGVHGIVQIARADGQGVGVDDFVLVDPVAHLGDHRPLSRVVEGRFRGIAVAVLVEPGRRPPRNRGQQIGHAGPQHHVVADRVILAVAVGILVLECRRHVAHLGPITRQFKPQRVHPAVAGKQHESGIVGGQSIQSLASVHAVDHAGQHRRQRVLQLGILVHPGLQVLEYLVAVLGGQQALGVVHEQVRRLAGDVERNELLLDALGGLRLPLDPDVRELLVEHCVDLVVVLYGARIGSRKGSNGNLFGTGLLFAGGIRECRGRADNDRAGQ